MAAILKEEVGSLDGAFGHCLGRNSETAKELGIFDIFNKRFEPVEANVFSFFSFEKDKTFE